MPAISPLIPIMATMRLMMCTRIFRAMSALTVSVTASEILPRATQFTHQQARQQHNANGYNHTKGRRSQKPWRKKQKTYIGEAKPRQGQHQTEKLSVQAFFLAWPEHNTFIVIPFPLPQQGGIRKTVAIAINHVEEF